MFKCHYCDKEFETKQKLAGHSTFCENNPNREHNLSRLNENRKKIKHTQKEIYNVPGKCKFCGKECKNHNSLINHERLCKLNPERDNDKLLKKMEKCREIRYLNGNNSGNQYTKAKLLGLPKPEISNETRSKIGSGWRGKKHTEEEKKKISEAMKKAVLEHPDSYSTTNINGRVKKYDYNGIKLDGLWEVTVAQYLDRNNIKWERPSVPFEYEWKGEIHNYFPDFYIPEKDIYIEVKGYEREKDKYKWEKVSNLIIIKKEEISLMKNGDINIIIEIIKKQLTY